MESTSVSFMFPGKQVVVYTACRWSGEPIEITAKDGVLLACSPPSTLLHVGLPFRRWPTDPHGTCANMSLFGSEETMREYIADNPARKGYPVTLEKAFEVMRVNAAHRLDYDYVTPFTWMYLKMLRPGIRGTFWLPGPVSSLRFMIGKGRYWR